MANTAIAIVRIIPQSPESNLEKIKESIREKMEKEGGKSITFEEKPLAFGLKAIILKMAFPEEKGTDFIEEIISKIPEVSSISIEDYRRAFG